MHQRYVAHDNLLTFHCILSHIVAQSDRETDTPAAKGRLGQSNDDQAGRLPCLEEGRELRRSFGLV